MPIDYQLNANELQIKFQLTTNGMSIDYQYNVNWRALHIHHLRSKTLDWYKFRIIRVPPLEIFSGTSRPMRSQHSGLLTNEKPRFWQDSRCLPNLESTNPMQMCQLTDNRVSLECTWNTNGLQREFLIIWHSIRCQLMSNLMAI